MTKNIQEYAQTYKSRGYAVLPIPYKQKGPDINGWSKRTVFDCKPEEEFLTDEMNLGILLGENSQGLVDIDLDCPEAIALAPSFLPETGKVFGRDSSPSSHWIYHVQGELKTKQYQDTDGMLLELRGTGAQTVFPPSVHPSGELVRFDKDGEPLAVQRNILEERLDQLAAASLLLKHWKEGNRHHLTLALAGGLLKAEWPAGNVINFLRPILSCAEDVEMEDRIRSIKNTEHQINAERNVTGFPTLSSFMGETNAKKVMEWLTGRRNPLPQPVLSGVPSTAIENECGKYTDLGNAQLFVSENEEDVRFVADMKSWLYWDTQKWTENADLEVRRLAQETVKRMISQIPATDLLKKSELYRWAQKSGNRERISAMLEEAKPHMSVKSDALDREPMLLNCANGIIDLSTGKLMPHQQDMMLTQIVPVKYNPDAQCPIFENFLDRIFNKDAELISYMQRAIGYSLSGSMKEQCFFVCHGDGSNGKSTLLDAIESIMSDFSSATPVQTLMASRNERNNTNDIARLRGKRFIKATEAEQTVSLAESFIKQWTGGDTITARFLCKEFFEFKPVGKLWLSTNHKPKIKGADTGIWRRVRLIPFEVTIPDHEKDRDLGQKLIAEREGILAWAVRGCLEWQRQGLGEPEKVKAATGEYRKEMDSVTTFADECLMSQYGNQVSLKDMYDWYVSWCIENGHDPAAKNDFGSGLSQKGIEQGKTGKKGRFWKNVGYTQALVL